MAYQPRRLPSRACYSALPSLRDRETDSWTPAHHARPVRGQTGSGPGLKAARADWARRKPRLLFRLSALFLLRLAERRFSGLLFQEPPRSTRRPPQGPFPDERRYGR